MRHDAAPHVDARPARRSFVGIELLAQRRVDAVAGDGNGAFDRSERFAGRPAHTQAHAIVAERIDADAGAAEDDPIGADALARRGEQHRVQVGTVDRQLRHVVAGPASGGLAVDVLAEAVEER